MKPLSRRDFLSRSAALGMAAPFLSCSAAGPGSGGLKVGVTDWNLGLRARLEAVETAARIGFDGVEVSFGNEVRDGKLPLAFEDRQQQYLAAFQEHGIQIAGTHLEILHQNLLKNDPLGQKWVADAIPATRNLHAKVILVPFFGRGALETRGEIDYVADIMKELGPEAERQGVVLGLENTLSAEDNARILERADSSAVQVYYDVGNSYGNGFDIYSEIRWLGRNRICQFHLKDNPHYLGEGEIDFQKVLELVSEIRFEGYGNLETSAPSSDVEADMRRNLDFIRSIRS